MVGEESIQVCVLVCVCSVIAAETFVLFFFLSPICFLCLWFGVLPTPSH